MTEEKQIEEMAKDIIKTKIRIDGLDYAMVEILNAETNKNYPFMQLAEKLYTADYRKQIYGEWLYSEDEVGSSYYRCSICHCQTRYKENYCCSCGAKMKGE